MLAIKPGLRGKSGFSFIQMLSLMLLLTALSVSIVSVGFNLPSKLFISAAPTGSLQTFRNEQLKYSLDIPANWKIVDQNQFGVMSATSPYTGQPVTEGGLDNRHLAFTGALTATPANGFSKIDVIVHELESPVDPSEFMRVMAVDPRSDRISEIEVAGLKAIKVEVGTGGALHDNQNINYINVFITTPTHGYIIAGFAQPAVFDAIISSFRTF